MASPSGVPSVGAEVQRSIPLVAAPTGTTLASVCAREIREPVRPRLMVWDADYSENGTVIHQHEEQSEYYSRLQYTLFVHISQYGHEMVLASTAGPAEVQRVEMKPLPFGHPTGRASDAGGG